MVVTFRRSALQSTPFKNPGGGYPERDGGGVVVAGRYFHFLLVDGCVTLCVVSCVVLHSPGSSDHIDRSRGHRVEVRLTGLLTLVQYGPLHCQLCR